MATLSQSLSSKHKEVKKNAIHDIFVTYKYAPPGAAQMFKTEYWPQT
jgi:hypothetical protein